MTKISDAAKVFLKARKDRILIDAFPEDLLPETPEEAYAIHAATMKDLGEVAGWKLAVSRPGGTPKASPIPQSRVLPSPATIVRSDLHAERAETEIAVRFSSDFPDRIQPYTQEDVAAAIGALCPAVELLASRFQNPSDMPALARLADLQGNACIVTGDDLTEWKGFDWETPQMTLLIDGVPVQSVEGSHPQANVLESLTWLVNRQRGTERPILAGDIIMTGAPNMTSCQVTQASRVDAAVAGLGKVEIIFEN